MKQVCYFVTHLLLDHHAGEVRAGDEEHAAEGVGDAVQGTRVVGRQVDEAELEYKTQARYIWDLWPSRALQSQMHPDLRNKLENGMQLAY